jgi:hypothetical protein
MELLSGKYCKADEGSALYEGWMWKIVAYDGTLLREYLLVMEISLEDCS